MEVGLDPRLPLPHLRDQDSVLDHRRYSLPVHAYMPRVHQQMCRLLPDDEWPSKVPPNSPAALPLHLAKLKFPMNMCEEPTRGALSKALAKKVRTAACVFPSTFLRYPVLRRRRLGDCATWVWMPP